MPKKPSNNQHRMVQFDQERFEADEAARLVALVDAAAAQAIEDADGMPTISPLRRAELKTDARMRIEARLAARRKARRLMRGGKVPE